MDLTMGVPILIAEAGNNAISAGTGETGESATRERTNVPFCSVIIPVYNASSTLPLCLESLRNLDYPPELLEIIVIDNGSTDDSVEIARRFGVQLLSETAVQSSYAARNTGIRAAKGELIAFTDADCIVTPGWLKHLVAGWDDETIGCFAGEIEAYQPETLVEKFSGRAGILRQRGTLECPYLPYAQTANAAYRKAVFDRIGLFVPEMTSGGDADIAWRMQKEVGLKIRFVPEALVYHKHRTDIQGLYSQYRKYEFGKYYWSRHYPDYRFPSFEQRKQELDQSVRQLCGSLKDNVVSLANDRIDFIDFVSPFLRVLMHAGTFKARVEIEKDRDAFTEDRLASVLNGKSDEEENRGGVVVGASATEAPLQQNVDELKAAIARKDEIIRQKDARINELLHSLSWQITAPLRKLYDVFKAGK